LGGEGEGNGRACAGGRDRGVEGNRGGQGRGRERERDPDSEEEMKQSRGFEATALTSAPDSAYSGRLKESPGHPLGPQLTSAAGEHTDSIVFPHKTEGRDLLRVLPQAASARNPTTACKGPSLLC
jgi:hypothetical protein